jgi:hypothetical protein
LELIRLPDPHLNPKTPRTPTGKSGGALNFKNSVA